MNQPTIDLQSDNYFMGEALRREALAHRQNRFLTVQIASGIVTP